MREALEAIQLYEYKDLLCGLLDIIRVGESHF